MTFQHDTPINRLLNLAIEGGALNKLVEVTETGNPVSFDTDVSKPLKSLLIPFSPVQAGTGDPSPENVRPISGWTGLNINRTGKNLISTNGEDLPKTQGGVTFSRNGSTYFVTASNEKSGYSFAKISEIVLKTGTYTLSADEYVTGVTIRIIDRTVTPVETIASATTNNATFTISGEKSNLLSVEIAANGSTIAVGEHAIKPQIETGETATAYAPYSGETIPVVFPATKNLLDFNAQSRHGLTVTKTGGKAVITGTATGEAFPMNFVAVMLPAGTYTWSVSGLKSGMSMEYAINGTWAGAVSTTSTFTLSEESRITGYVKANEGTETNTTVAVQLESGSAATPFEPYGTVYGGELDALTGILTVSIIGLTGKLSGYSEKTHYDSTGSTLYRFYNPTPLNILNNNAQKCNIAKRQWTMDNGTTHFFAYTISDGETSLLYNLNQGK